MGFGERPYSVTPELLQLLAPVKSIAQRSRRPQRGEMGFGELLYSVTPELLQLLAPVKSIAQRSRRPQRRIWAVGPNLFSGQCGFKCENSRSFSSTES
jgi:hypothetical protein